MPEIHRPSHEIVAQGRRIAKRGGGHARGENAHPAGRRRDAPGRPARNARGTAQAPGRAALPYLFYARNAAYFRAAKAMWAALQQETKRVPVTLRALLNRRVASWNGCEF